MPARPFYLSHFVAVTPLLFASVALAEPLSVAIGESVVIDADRVADGVSLNEGTIDLSPAVTLSTEGRFTNASTGFLSVGPGGTLRSLEHLVNRGSIYLFGGTLENSATGVFDHYGDLSGGLLENAGTFNYYFDAQLSVDELLNSGEFNQYADFSINVGQRVQNEGLVNNNGQVYVNGGELSTTGEWVNELGASIFLSTGSVFRNSGRLINYGGILAADSVFENAAGGVVDHYGRLATDLLRNAGTFNYHGGSQLSFSRLLSSGTFNQYADLSLSAEQRVQNEGIYNIGGTTQFSQLWIDNGAEFTSSASGAVNNYGQVYVDGGELSTAGEWVNTQRAWIDVRSGGAFRNNGRLINHGGILAADSVFENAASGVVDQYGTLTVGRFQNAGTFNVHAGQVYLDRLENTGTFNQRSLGGIAVRDITNRGLLNFEADASLEGELVNHGAGETFDHQPLAAGTMRIGPGAHVQANNIIRNEGLIVVEEQGFLDGFGDFIQRAGELRVDGDMTQGLVHILGGSLTGSGEVIAPQLLIGEGAALVPGGDGSIAQLSLFGDADIAGTVLIDIEDEQSFDRVLAGAVNFEEGASVVFSAMDAFGLKPGQELEFLVATEILGLEYLAFDFSALSNEFNYSVNRSIGGLSLAVSEIPVPASVWLMLSALMGLRVAAHYRSK